MEVVTLCQVAVSAATYAIDKPYTYLVPEGLLEAARPGMRCIVPFSQGNRRVEGILLRVWQGEKLPRLKQVLQLLDEQPVLDEAMLELALWMQQRYFCTVYDGAKAMLPTGLYYALRDNFSLCAGVDEARAFAETVHAPAQRRVVEVLLAGGGMAERQAIYAAFEKKSPTQALRALQDKGLIRLETSSVRGIGDKTEQVAELACPEEEALAQLKPSAKAQRAVVRFLAQVGGGASLKDIDYFTGAKKATLTALEKKGLVALFHREVFRREGRQAVERQSVPTLNAEQEAAFRGIAALMDAGQPACALLYGVTGSGKTLVYIRLIHKALAEGKTALMLVPEIALTPQMLRRFQAQFGERVAVLHSALSVGERYDEWKRAKSGRAQVVIGTRSAIFAPLEGLGLIILDEEQEGSYKSETLPRYHARDIAKYRCKQTGATLVLGSATPCIETMYQARQGRYHLFRLRERYNEQALPKVYVADLKQELRSGNDRAISRGLQKLIGINLDKGEQTILFLNRRGTSRLVVCPACGYTPECPNCSVKLTYHGDNGRLMCHYCGFSQEVPQNCPACASPLTFAGVGIQKVQQELTDLFPGTEILRMDADTVSASNSHEKILSRFEREKIPILIGTQMVTKGLDFENVTLVGVIDADLALFNESYRAAERTFSLLTQVVGRAGRGGKTGTAVIQTYTPKNDTIRFAAAQDYDSFYASELELRQARGFPPFRDLYILTCSGQRQTDVVESCIRLREGLKSWRGQPEFRENPFEVLGPASAPVLRVMGRYRYQLTLTCRDSAAVRRMLAALQKAFMTEKMNRGVSLSVDLNPMD